MTLNLDIHPIAFAYRVQRGSSSPTTRLGINCRTSRTRLIVGGSNRHGLGHELAITAAVRRGE